MRKMGTSYNRYKDKDEWMSLESEISNPDPPNTGQLINSNDETQKTEKLP